MLHPGLLLTPCLQPGSVCPSMSQLVREWPGRDRGWPGCGHDDEAAGHPAVPSCCCVRTFPGWWQQQRTLPMVSPSLLELFASALEARKALPGAGGVSHHDLSKNPCSGIFLIPPSPWREVGGSSLLAARCCRCCCFSHLLPLPTRQTSRTLALAPHKSPGHS